MAAPWERRADVIADAHAICPVRLPCLDYGLANQESWGVWGGPTVGDRREEWLRCHGETR